MHKKIELLYELKLNVHKGLTNARLTEKCEFDNCPFKNKIHSICSYCCLWSPLNDFSFTIHDIAHQQVGCTLYSLVLEVSIQ